MKEYCFLIFLLIIFRNCFGQFPVNETEYILVDGYVFAENLEHKKINCKDCDNENKIFKVDKKFIYSYKYLDTKNNAFLFKILDNGQWDFVSISSKEPNVVRNIELQIMPDGENFSNPIFCQTRIGYRLHTNFSNFTTTGLIENIKNIWIHPPRQYLFHILELNPFPYIKAPYAIGSEWKWELAIGPQWGDKRWKEWNGEIHNFYHYKITETTTISSKFGNLKCFVIEGKAKSELGETELKSYFNVEYGFVQLEYKNIDNSTIKLNLERIENPSIFKQ